MIHLSIELDQIARDRMDKFLIGCGKRERFIDSALINVSDGSYNFVEIG